MSSLSVWVTRGAALWPGLAMSAMVAVAALFLAEHYDAPVMLFALLLGMAVNFLSKDERCKPGIDFVARQVLRWGVALLGLKVTLEQVQALGWQSTVIVAVAVTLTISIGIFVAKAMGFRPFFGLLSGGAVGICGASAALAIAAAFPNHPQKDRATLFVVISVSTLSTMAMVLYPMLVHQLAFDARDAGFFLGATIHDVAQVVGAGYSMGQQTGDTATVVKLMRVAMLVPVIMIAAWMTRIAHTQQKEAGSVASTPSSRPPLLPWFVAVFVLLVILNSFFPLPGVVINAGHGISRIFLVTAMAAIGIKTQLKDILSVGWKPVALVFIETLFLATFVYGFLWHNV